MCRWIPKRNREPYAVHDRQVANNDLNNVRLQRFLELSTVSIGVGSPLARLAARFSFNDFPGFLDIA